jgi:GxxExxY protein
MSGERDAQTYTILGAAMEVHNEMGRGFRELPYQDAFELELGFRSIPFEREPPVVIHYKGNPLKSTYSPDFICYAAVIVELKAVEALTDDHRAQVINYLKATHMHRALLLNFGQDRLVYERIVLNYPD